MMTIIVVAVIAFLLFVAIILLFMYYNVIRTFMVRDLELYGGTIEYQGKTYKVSKGAEITVRIDSIIVVNPDGKTQVFRVGNNFAPQPVVTIGDE